MRRLQMLVIGVATFASVLAIAVGLTIVLWLAMKHFGALEHDYRHGNFHEFLMMLLFGAFPIGGVAGIVLGLREARSERPASLATAILYSIAGFAAAGVFAFPGKSGWALLGAAIAFLAARVASRLGAS
jgi:cytochrome bd-type quinol oxidase subunit 2